MVRVKKMLVEIKEQLNCPVYSSFLSSKYMHPYQWTLLREFDTWRHHQPWMYHTGSPGKCYPGFPDSSWGLTFCQQWELWWSSPHQGSGKCCIKARYVLPWHGARPHRPTDPHTPLTSFGCNTLFSIVFVQLFLSTLSALVLSVFFYSSSYWCWYYSTDVLLTCFMP